MSDLFNQNELFLNFESEFGSLSDSELATKYYKLVESRNAQNRFGQAICNAYLIINMGLNAFVNRVSLNKDLHDLTQNGARRVHMNTGADTMTVVKTRVRNIEDFCKIIRGRYDSIDYHQLVQAYELGIMIHLDQNLRLKLKNDEVLYNNITSINSLEFLVATSDFIVSFFQLPNFGGIDVTDIKGLTDELYKIGIRGGLPTVEYTEKFYSLLNMSLDLTSSFDSANKLKLLARVSKYLMCEFDFLNTILQREQRTKDYYDEVKANIVLLVNQTHKTLNPNTNFVYTIAGVHTGKWVQNIED